MKYDTNQSCGNWMDKRNFKWIAFRMSVFQWNDFKMCSQFQRDSYFKYYFDNSFSDKIRKKKTSFLSVVCIP